MNNLAVQWCESLAGALDELCRVVPWRSGGVQHLAGRFASRAESGWCAIDRHPHANRFLSEQAVREALAGRRAVGEVHAVSLPFADALSAMRSLKGIGATHLHQGAARRR